MLSRGRSPTASGASQSQAGIDEEDNLQVTINQTKTARGAWHLVISVAAFSMLMLTLFLPAWVSISVPYNDNMLNVHGTISYVLGLQGATVTGVYNSITRTTYMSFQDIDASNGSAFNCILSRNATIGLVIVSAVCELLGVLLYRRIRVRVDGKDGGRMGFLYLLMILTPVVELSAMLSYHLGNYFIVNLRKQSTSVSLQGSSVTLLLAILLDFCKMIVFCRNFTTTPGELFDATTQATRQSLSKVWPHPQ